MYRARVLAVEPEVLLMDEPCSALDPNATFRIEELMQTLRRDYTIVIVTHNMQQAARVSQRTGFFLKGELVELGDTERMFTSPARHADRGLYPRAVWVRVASRESRPPKQAHPSPTAPSPKG